MKQVMILVLILGVSSAASAGLVFNPNGTYDDGGMPVELSVVSTGSITGWQFSISVEGGTIVDETYRWCFPVAWIVEPYVKSYDDTHIEVTGGDFFPKPGPLTILTGVTITRTATQAIVTLMATGSNNVDGGVVPAGTLMDTLVITPEPMSLMLLGLGGLFLRRRK
ncbi:MAG: PEP-CTERM sorting domain-containing protein [Phycisphaerae bacterium]|nr:PEP-CTERM sorting domain-containing protein [Phycisphaerae bacterium]